MSLVSAADGVECRSAPFARYFSMADGMFDMEVGIATSKAITPTGRVVVDSIPGGKYIQTTHTGPYENLGKSWGAFTAWTEAHGISRGKVVFEEYVTDPTKNPDMWTWETLLRYPVVDGE